MRPVALQKNHSNIGMIDFEYLSTETSESMFELAPIQATLLYEENKKGQFRELHLLDHDFHEADSDMQQRDLPYMDSDLLKSMPNELSVHERKGRFAKPFSKKSKQSILEKSQTVIDSNVTERLLNFIISKKFQSFTFIVWNEMQLKTIMKQLIMFALTPTILHNRSKYYLICLPQMDITFVSRESYISGDLNDLRRTYCNNIPEEYFPFSFLSQHSFRYSGEPPDKTYYVRPEHSVEEKKRIELWLRKQEKKTWKIAEELKKFAHYKMTVFSATIQAFLKFTYHLQTEMWYFFKPKAAASDEIPLFSPFTYPIMSIGSLSFTLFRYFALKSQLFSVNFETGRPNFRSSQGELEFVSFLTELVAPAEVYTTFSIHNQKAFQFIRPDFYCPQKKYAACFQGMYQWERDIMNFN